jgi:exosome complex RNA-binding protein Csl4
MEEYGAKTQNRRMQMTVAMPLSLIAVLDDIAESEGVTTQTIIIRAVRAGLKVERDMRESKHRAKELEHA